MRILRNTGFILALCLLLSACGGNQDNQGQPGENPANDNGTGESVSPVIAEQAQTIFSNSCIQCHGSELQGLMGDQSNLQQVGVRLSREEIATVIREGRNQMPSFGGTLSEDEIEVLAEWLAAKK